MNEPKVVTKDDLETAKIEILSALAETKVDVAASVEAMRKQNSHEHGRMQRVHDWVADQVDRMLTRLGFLADKNHPRPPPDLPP